MRLGQLTTWLAAVRGCSHLTIWAFHTTVSAFFAVLKLKNEGAVATDIDAAVFDTTTGTLGLFQLKWQDPFGTSMRRRNSKMMNFLEETNQWVSTVSSILLEKPEGT